MFFLIKYSVLHFLWNASMFSELTFEKGIFFYIDIDTTLGL